MNPNLPPRSEGQALIAAPPLLISSILLPVMPQRQQRPDITVAVVVYVKIPGQAGACGIRGGPAVLVQHRDQPGDSLVDLGRGPVVRGDQGVQRPSRLRRRAGAKRHIAFFTVAAAGFAPAAVRIAHAQQPAYALGNGFVIRSQAGGLQPRKRGPRPVDIADSPAAVP